ncbi:hypothetical protein [Microbacterium stercoris]|uniref:Uncharacterized protein n=1 Tax=Microbacterium stercoris TaxID=2820289 RepID=A0A939QQM9_9MICO|nr:hypothetical protein [Microbacterium stercoris]MBO3663696.1 hypothetical protein [Microbacterium stercoris]
MTKQTPADEVTAIVAADLRAELARQRRTAADLAHALDVTPHTVGRRLNGDVPFSMYELVLATRWLGIDLTDLVSRATQRAAA